MIVNPNQPGCGFESKNLAGVGVMFYVLLALRAELRARGALRRGEPAAARRAARPGRARHRRRRRQARRQQPPAGRAGPEARPRRPHAARARGAVRGRRRATRSAPARSTSASRSGPRINAAGRLADMTLGIECLLTDDAGARRRAGARARRASTASGARSKPACASRPRRCSTACSTGATSRRRRSRCSTPTFHEGVVGIVAVAPEGPAAPADLRVRARRATAHAEGLGPLDRRLSPARCARPRRQAPPRRAAALRRPRDGGRLHARRGATSTTFDAALQQVAREWLDAGDADARAAHRRPARRSSTSAPTRCARSTRRSGARPSRRRCSATRSRSCRSAWSARST